ncbi:MAG: ABC transporter ATP-binding protein [Clostridiales bacterium]|nr:ABC transporter ATP-binding protein [Clostridiales bacterium]
MDDIHTGENVIVCDHIVKDYSLYSTFGDKIKGLFLKESRVSTFRALDDISVTMKKGECVGLIGLNGSGKSTLASIITGITSPSSGSVSVQGEVSMLCASSGMRSQLSGIDNIRFKCLLLGFNEKQIKEIEQDIIDFADIGIHINQPVKTYSSGMRSRLGFAISVHVNPDILIIDEALSVGDSSFTEKCLKKVDEFKESGKTIVFVSHAVTTMTTFCDRIIWINQGKLIGVGTPDEIIKPYCGFAREFNGMTNEQRKECMPDLKEYQQKYCG